MPNKHYSVLSKKDNFLYGAFPFSKEGLKLARSYLNKISGKNKKDFYIKKNTK